jgi:hypothetical protein
MGRKSCCFYASVLHYRKHERSFAARSHLALTERMRRRRPLGQRRCPGDGADNAPTAGFGQIDAEGRGSGDAGRAATKRKAADAPLPTSARSGN